MARGYEWIAMLDRLADGDITKHKEIYNINYISCLNLLAYWQAKDEFNKVLNKVK